MSKEYDDIYDRKESYKCHYSKSPYYKIWMKVAEYIKDTDTVVDIGCGTGQMMELLQEKGINKYIGYDFSQSGINLAKQKIKDPSKFSVYWQDLYELNSFPDADDYITIEVLEHLVEDIKVLNLIPKDKKVIITVPNYLGGSHVRKFDTEEDVKNRYAQVINCEEITTMNYGNGLIFVMMGKKI